MKPFPILTLARSRSQGRAYSTKSLAVISNALRSARSGVMTSIEAKLNCEWHIADLKLRLAQLKAGSELGTDVSASAEFINLLQHNLDSWEDRKKTLVELH